MQQERVMLFLDYANTHRAARDKGRPIDYYHFLNYVGEGRFLVEAYSYVPIDPRNEHRMDRDIEELWRSGYIVTTKRGSLAAGTYKCNFDVEIAMDMLKAVYQVKPDIIVLASGDSDFVSLIQEVRKSGVRVEVAAFTETAGADILLKASGFIDLDVYYESYLAALEHEDGEEDTGGEDESNADVDVDERFKDLIRAQNSIPDDVDEADEDADEEDEEGEESKSGNDNGKSAHSAMKKKPAVTQPLPESILEKDEDDEIDEAIAASDILDEMGL